MSNFKDNFILEQGKILEGEITVFTEEELREIGEGL